MSDITQIRVRVETANIDGAGTDAWIYLALAGREFCLDPGSGNSYFEQGAKTCFVLGEQGGADGGEAGFTDVAVEDAEWNDPRKPQLDTEDLGLAPAYIRFAKAGSNPPWCVERVKVTVRASDGKQYHFDNFRLREVKDNRQLWLHDRYGERLFLYHVTTD
ncbi:hypothetical protein [Streptomyces tauricus]|uniref:hypothetical protein n=1 Tax=Streptomyces tauricus TaxID=68274 RepID=UPI0037F5C1F0